MKLNIEDNQPLNYSYNRPRFNVEFYAYNFSANSLIKKVYFFPEFRQDKESITLSHEESNILSKVLENEILLSFKTEKYTLCDLSLRGTNHIENIGFSFKVIDDTDYIDPSYIIKYFLNYNISPFYNTIIQIQKSLFSDKPSFNPVSMMGLLFNHSDLKSIKVYIRFDYNEINTYSGREKLIENVISSINPNCTEPDSFLACTKVIEGLGFHFAFVGVDYDMVGKNRYKLYYRTTGKYNPLITQKEIKNLLLGFGLYDSIEEVFNKNYREMWGVAVSTTNFNKVDGIQLYFYPN